MNQRARIYVAGQQTLIGSAMLRELNREGYSNLIVPPAGEPELTEADQVEALFDREAPEYVFVAAGKSGGIEMNRTHPAELIRDNVLIACHLIESAHRHGVKKLLYLTSSCSYPRDCPQPMRVESLMSGPLEPTSEAYAMAKLAGMQLCQAYRREYEAPFIVGIPGDPFGPGDDFDPENSHVIAALIRKMHEAKTRGEDTVDVWGTGSPRRGFSFVDDVANACLFLMREYDDIQPINLGSGWDVSIRDVATEVQGIVGFQGTLRFDASKPDGMPVKIVDCRRLNAMGWRPQWTMRAALSATYEWFLQLTADPRGASMGAGSRA